MNFIFGDPELISQAFYPILAISLILNGVVCAIVYKAFGVNKWLVLGAGVLMLIASATFSSFNLSTIFYQLSVQDKTLNLYFAFPYPQSRQLAFAEVRYADAITPEAKSDNCHVVIEDKTGMLYQSLDLHSRVFYNPKLGLSYDVNARLNAYASVAMANKEPNRNDFTESSPGSRPKHEQLTDVEAGLKYTRRSLNMAFNVYNMRYRNQLVLNGQVNDVGAYTRINVPNSYRRGVELELGAEIGKHLALNGNVAFSRSKIKNFTEFVDSSDASGSVYYAQHRNTYKNTDISFSPNVVGAASLIYKPLRGFEITLVHKYVGRQYLDNTGNTQRSIAPYTVFDLRLNYSIKTELVPEVELMLGIYNLTNRRYETNGYTFGYYAGGQLYTYNYLAPAAPINVLGGVALKF